MEITDVRIYLKESAANVRLKAYATITLDGNFVVRNLKVIEGTKGLFVAMPSERAKEPCPKCGYRNALRSKFCNQCGGSLPSQPPGSPSEGHEEGSGASSEHRDIAHPITTECREVLQRKVLDAYEAAKEGGGQPTRGGGGQST